MNGFDLINAGNAGALTLPPVELRDEGGNTVTDTGELPAWESALYRLAAESIGIDILADTEIIEAYLDGRITKSLDKIFKKRKSKPEYGDATATVKLTEPIGVIDSVTVTPLTGRQLFYNSVDGSEVERTVARLGICSGVTVSVMKKMDVADIAEIAEVAFFLAAGQRSA